MSELPPGSSSWSKKILLKPCLLNGLRIDELLDWKGFASINCVGIAFVKSKCMNSAENL
jgi:hypothetical protein